MKERDHFQHLDVVGRTILHEVRGLGVDWMDPTQDRGKWRVLVNAVMTIRVP
jgi:hypothetical protein